ncbi:MAG: hypothetical protein HRU20_15085 [Pseudomonadales bacterium]|nr:hypothetical protein [Pseudomonadales bacterium]
MLNKLSLLAITLIVSACGADNSNTTKSTELQPELLGTWGEIKSQDQMTFINDTDVILSITHRGEHQELDASYEALSDGVVIELFGQKMTYRYVGNKLCEVSPDGVVMTGTNYCAAKVATL